MKVATRTRRGKTDFKKWLRKHDLDQYYQNLLDERVESIECLTVMTKDEIVELASSFGMNFKTRLKFVNAIYELSVTSPSLLAPELCNSPSTVVPSTVVRCSRHNNPVA